MWGRIRRVVRRAWDAATVRLGPDLVEKRVEVSIDMGLEFMLIRQGVVTAVGDGWFEWRQDGAHSVQRIPFTSVRSFRVL